MVRVSKGKCKVFVTVALALFIIGAGFTARSALVSPPAPERENTPSAEKEKSKPADRADTKPSRDPIVKVTDGDGKPVASAAVHFLTLGQPAADGRTDGDGRWTGRVPADTKAWSVFAYKAKVGFDYATFGRPPGSQEKPLPLPDQLTLKLDGARTVRVKTVDRQGKPIAGVKVGPWVIHKPGREIFINLSGTSRFWPTTDEDGTAVLNWLPARFEQNLRILPLSDDYYSLDFGTPLPADKLAAELVIPHLPMERLSGRVTHSDGRPAAGISVSAHGRGTGSHEFRGTVRTDADGRYTMKVYAEQVYILAVGDDKWAAPYRSGILVRTGEPVASEDFRLRRAIRLHGRVTVGKDERPAPGAYLVVVFGQGEVPPGFRRKNDRFHFLTTSMGKYADKDGRFEFHLGPGAYMLNGPDQTKSVKVTIPVLNPPAEIVQDFRMPRP